MRFCRLRSLAKINLDLRVLAKRPDGFHELRTVFQTISLADILEIEYQPARRTSIALKGTPEIADNLVVRAAEAFCEAARLTGSIRFRLEKRIPMGAGLGGGSSNAAAVLLALPALAGIGLDPAELHSLAVTLGSDVPYFLYGGTVLGLGRGTELYPLPDLKTRPGVLVTSDLHVSTAEAYQALNRRLTTSGYETDTESFQAFVWGMCDDRAASPGPEAFGNDFESVVFRRYPRLESVRDQLRQSGAKQAMMTGSGSAVFGLFDSRQLAAGAATALAHGQEPGARHHRFSLVTRRGYRSLWLGQLKDHVLESIWPPQSRYSKR